ncbi:Uncharacterised protein [Vibrio cholerae]|nr:Uncharacterised protein [Vibrio cholerae]
MTGKQQIGVIRGDMGTFTRHQSGFFTRLRWDRFALNGVTHLAFGRRQTAHHRIIFTNRDGFS